ncbi:hypothetical protein MHYP_G00288170 [Metynnis hypsauchen]
MIDQRAAHTQQPEQYKPRVDRRVHNTLLCTTTRAVSVTELALRSELECKQVAVHSAAPGPRRRHVCQGVFTRSSAPALEAPSQGLVSRLSRSGDAAIRTLYTNYFDPVITHLPCRNRCHWFYQDSLMLHIMKFPQNKVGHAGDFS